MLTFLLAISGGGCGAQLAGFQKMSSRDRAEYVCERDGRISALRDRVIRVEQAIDETREAIARGYKIHESCDSTVISLGEECTYKGESLVCSDGNISHTVCDDTPVAIDGRLEREKLRSYERDIRRYERELKSKSRSCRNRVGGMSPEAAYDYHLRHRSSEAEIEARTIEIEIGY